MNATVIETRGLTMRFPAQAGWKALLKQTPGSLALDAVDLDVHRGEVFGLLGPNGAGKTTLVRILATLMHPSAGRARVNGLDVVRDSIGVRRAIGVVYGDERAFFWRLSGYENLMFCASLYGLRGSHGRDRVHELLELVGLAASAHVRMHHYSTGMKQRASIARALLHDPDILIMDEPTRALDPIAAAEMRQFVRERVLDGERTVLLATNQLDEAEALCDRLAFISHGRLLATGEIGYLRGLLQADEIHELVVGGLEWRAALDLRLVNGVTDVELTALEGDRLRLVLTVAREQAAIPRVITRAVELGGSVWSCSERVLSLDEIFSRVVLGETPTQRAHQGEPRARDGIPA